MPAARSAPDEEHPDDATRPERMARPEPAETSGEEDHPGWMKRLGHRVKRMLVAFRALVDRRPWLALAYKITIALIGGIVILAGIAMLVLPGPGWLTIFLGLAIMGTEFVWARKILTWLRKQVTIAADRWRRWRAARAEAKAERARQQESGSDA